MNITILDSLAEHMEDGAPMAVFDMEIYGESVKFTDNNAWGLEAEQKLLGDRGVVCCLAGYTLLMFGIDPINAAERAMTALLARALLGLEANNPIYGHDLFSPTLAPEFCTPAQAAVAVRNVIAGKNPW